MNKRQDVAISEELNPTAQEPYVSPSAIATPREANQADMIQAMQRQIGELTQALGQISKQTGAKVKMTERDDSAMAFLRVMDGKTVVGWQMKPGSYSTVNSFGVEVDEQYIKVKYEDGSESDFMPYRQFDSVSKLGQLAVRIPGYFKKDNEGRWMPIPRGLNDLLKCLYSKDGGLTYTEPIEVPSYSLN